MYSKTTPAYLLTLALAVLLLSGCAGNKPTTHRPSNQAAGPPLPITAVELDQNGDGAIDIELGGTGGTTAAAARTALGLGSVANTADLAKPISTATQDALDLKASISAVLTKTNATTYAPTADYNPATKKYVDDAALLSGTYTDEQAQDAVGAMLTGNTETGITVTYDDATNKINFEVTGGGVGLPSWMPSVGPTAPRQILQAVGGCSNAVYTTEETCTTNSGTWTPITYQSTSIVQGLINDGGSGTDDLLSAHEVNARILAGGGAVDLTAPGPIGTVTPNTGKFTALLATSFDTSAPAIGETGEIGFSENPANGTNTVTLKAPDTLAADLIIPLPGGVVPATSLSPCQKGQWWFDDNNFYICVGTNNWRKILLTSWL